MNVLPPEHFHLPQQVLDQFAKLKFAQTFDGCGLTQRAEILMLVRKKLAQGRLIGAAVDPKTGDADVIKRSAWRAESAEIWIKEGSVPGVRMANGRYRQWPLFFGFSKDPQRSNVILDSDNGEFGAQLKRRSGDAELAVARPSIVANELDDGRARNCRPIGSGYQETDRPALVAMRELLETRQANSPSNAAMQILKRGEPPVLGGDSNAESKKTRLVKGYKKWINTENNGQ